MEKVDEYLKALPDWQQANLELFRNAVHEVEPSIVEDFKWDVPVYLLKGKILFAMSVFKAHTKFNFIGNGAYLDDQKKLFNSGLDSKKSRGIDLREGETINGTDLKALIKESITKSLA